MTKQECQSGLGSNGQFFIKSRFAVCTGQLFHQTWKLNKKPIGESSFITLAVGTIAKGSRQMHVQYYFTDFQAMGGTGTARFMIAPDATVPQKWPATAQTSQGGSIPGARSFDTLAATGTTTFEHTVTVASGQGDKPDDTVFAVYQPTVKLTYPPGWDSKGTDTVNLFLLAPRWDKAAYVSRGDGAAVFSDTVDLPYSSKTGASEKAVAEHIRDAFTKPGATFPKNAHKNVPGADVKHPLNRLYHDAKRRAANRSEAIKVCKKQWGPGYPQGGKNECDEYPFAVTYQGSAQALYDSTAPKDNFSARPLPKADNGAAGTILAGFLTKNRIIDGKNDGFTVSIN
ncbi:hypothetical protein GCM10010211_85860 [Streptomyces albospinus]|uniref:Deoxyribonuclease NucA/NucB domain-containing protein n=1 Tax=Streptomyces albospinus TaxID=285515 RepID=A0ABQ2VT06_9ACTN|nr:hypothetical protein [Streptomyces albospinus]GGV06013.1 hypothetical protein GCM10010211_85860 [Streptomyces albospinus]